MEPHARGGLAGMDAHMEVDGEPSSADVNDDKLEVLWTIPAPSHALLRRAMEATPVTNAVDTPAPTPRPAGSLPMAVPAAVLQANLDDVRPLLDCITNDLAVVVPDDRGSGLMRIDLRSLEPEVFVNDAGIHEVGLDGPAPHGRGGVRPRERVHATAHGSAGHPAVAQAQADGR
mmetsp:Transcript_22601/g.58121  ORF Transcript_22601/g.58121 Transcript_22601/m.58121 type:complete len:174 (+) Transcript_22601:1357-1878(+)